MMENNKVRCPICGSANVIRVPVEFASSGRAITCRCLNRACGYHFYASLAPREEPAAKFRRILSEYHNTHG